MPTLDPEAQKKLQEAIQLATEELKKPEGKLNVLSHEACKDYPAIDIAGKFTRTDLAFSEQQERVNVNVQLAAPSVRNLIENMQGSPAFKEFRKTAQTFSLEAAIYHRAGDHLRDQFPDAAKVMDKEAKHTEQRLLLSSYAQALKTMEFLSGDSKEPIPGKMKDCCEMMSCPIDARVNQDRGTRRSGINVLGLKFQSDEARYTMENPQHDMDLLGGMDYAPDYCAAVARRMREPLFSQLSAKMNIDISTNSMFFVERQDGKMRSLELLVEDTAKERYGDKAGPLLRDDKLKQTIGDELLGAAVMSGQRVIGYIPQGAEQSLKPVVISRDGYEPTPKEPVHMNRWEQFWSKHGGFYKEKAKRFEEYTNSLQQVKETEAQIQADLKDVYAPEPLTRLRDMMALADTIEKAPAVKAYVEYANAYKKEARNVTTALHTQMFGDTELKTSSQYHLTRTPETRGIAIMLVQGHSVADIMNPDMLHEEKAAAGKTLLEMQGRDDPKEYAQAMHAGLEKLIGEAEKLKMDFTSRADTLKQCRTLTLLGSAHDVWQEVTGREETNIAMEDIQINKKRVEAGLPAYSNRAEYERTLVEREVPPAEKALIDQCKADGIKANNNFVDRVYNVGQCTRSIPASAQIFSIRQSLTNIAGGLEAERMQRQAYADNARNGKNITQLGGVPVNLLGGVANMTVMQFAEGADTKQKCDIINLACSGKPLLTQIGKDKRDTPLMNPTNEFQMAAGKQPQKTAGRTK